MHLVAAVQNVNGSRLGLQNVGSFGETFVRQSTWLDTLSQS
jgi:hypothetical protein